MEDGSRTAITSTAAAAGAAWRIRILALSCCAPLLLFADPRTADARADHPRLVSDAATACATCHGDRLRGPATVHGPVRDGCSFCHDVTIAEAGTQIALRTPEPALCLECHDAMAGAAGGAIGHPHPPATESCLGCHEAHASAHPALLVATQAELCGACHDPEESNAKHGGQMTPSTDCARCHDPHGSGNARLLRGSGLHAPFADGSCDACHRAPLGDRVRLRARGERLCTACHGNSAAPAADGGSVHAALHGEGGRAGCLHCHDPHMSDQSRLLLDDGGRLCGSCHAEILDAARAPSGHPPAGEDCLNCHRPHASDQPRLLASPPHDLCGGCHDSGDADLTKAHLGADLASLTCTDCHTPHGSGHPHLLARHLHPPVLEGCETCHEGTSGRLVEGGGPALCLMCHEEIGDRAAKSEIPHPAMDVARCVDCHNPHASNQERLVKQPGGGECLACHDEKGPRAGESAHGAITVIGCRACHEPHGGTRAGLLRIAGPELCLSCHDPARSKPDDALGTVRLLGRFDVPVESARAMARLRLSADGQRNHPVPNHRVLGTPSEDELKRSRTTHRGAMTCLTCHDPHKSRSRSLLLWDAVGPSEACVQCHAK